MEIASSRFWRREEKREVSIRNVEQGRGEMLGGKQAAGRVGRAEEVERREGERRGMRD